MTHRWPCFSITRGWSDFPKLSVGAKKVCLWVLVSDFSLFCLQPTVMELKRETSPQGGRLTVSKSVGAGSMCLCAWTGLFWSQSDYRPIQTWGAYIGLMCGCVIDVFLLELQCTTLILVYFLLVVGVNSTNGVYNCMCFLCFLIKPMVNSPFPTVT